MKFKSDSISDADKAKILSQVEIPQNIQNQAPAGQKQHVNIVFCIPGREFTCNFLQSWTKLCNALYQNNISFVLSNAYSPVVYYARSACLRLHVLRGKHQKPFNEEITYDYIFWIDSDIVFEPEHLFTILKRMQENRDMQVLGGVYMMADGYHTTIVDKWDEEFFAENGSFKFLTKEDLNAKKGVFECVYAGFGWLCVRYGVHESFEYPHFRPTFHTLKNDIYDFSSEDASFFLELKEKGIKAYIDPDVRVGHEKMIVIPSAN